MLELFRWKEEEIRNLRRDIERLLGRFMSHYGLEGASAGSLWQAIQICEDEDTVYMEIALPDLEEESLRLYLSGRSLMLLGRRRIPYIGYKNFRKIIELPFSPKESEIQVNYKEHRLLLRLKKIRKKVHRLAITEV